MFGLNRDMQLERATKSATSFFGVEVDNYAIIATMQGTIQEMTVSETYQKFGQANIRSFRIWFRTVDVDSIKPEDRITVVGEGDDNIVYRVLQTEDAVGRLHHFECLVELVN